MDPEDPDTWSDGWPVGCRNFLDPLEPCSEVETWRNRVNPAVNRVFDVLWEGLPELDSDEAQQDLPMGEVKQAHLSRCFEHELLSGRCQRGGR